MYSREGDENKEEQNKLIGKQEIMICKDQITKIQIGVHTQPRSAKQKPCKHSNYGYVMG